MSEKDFYKKKYNHIIELIENNSLTEAETNLIKIIDERQNEFYPYQLLGIVYTKIGDTNKAIDNYYKSLKINQNNPSIFLSIAKIYENQKNLIEAAKFYQKGLSIDKNNTHLIESFSAFLIKFGELSKGIAYQYKHFGVIRFNKKDFEIK